MARLIRRRAEPTITLINVVFLLLAFFLVAGTLAQRPPETLRLVSLSDGTAAPLRDVVVLYADGTVAWPDGVTEAAGVVAGLPEDAPRVARILPDRAAPAQALVALARALQEAGAVEVRILAETRVEP